MLRAKKFYFRGVSCIFCKLHVAVRTIYFLELVAKMFYNIVFFKHLQLNVL
jgi:hypothetical protein